MVLVPAPIPPTPVISPHARARCAEMGISTKVAKRIVQHADVSYAGLSMVESGRRMHLSREHPAYAVVTAPLVDGRLMVVTVVFNTRDPYVRGGETFTIAKEA